ncbi:unnamed protein product [Rhodiola kirilowii]
MATYYNSYYDANTTEILAAYKARSEKFDKEFDRRMSLLEDKLRGLQTENSHPLKEAIDSTPSSKFPQVQSSVVGLESESLAVGFDTMVESVGSASAENNLASIDVTDKSDSAIATGVFEDDDLDVSTSNSHPENAVVLFQTPSSEPPFQVLEPDSVAKNISTCAEDLCDNVEEHSPSEPHQIVSVAIESSLIFGSTMKSDVIDVIEDSDSVASGLDSHPDFALTDSIANNIDTNLYSSPLRNHFPLVLMLNEAGLFDQKEIHGFANQIGVPNGSISICSQGVCQNASMGCSSYFIMCESTDSYILVPAAKVDDLSVLLRNMNDSYKMESSLLCRLQPWKGIKGVQRCQYVKIIDGNFVYDKGKSRMFANEWQEADVEGKMKVSMDAVTYYSVLAALNKYELLSYSLPDQRPPSLPPENDLKIDVSDDVVAELENGVDSLFESFARFHSHMLSVGQNAVKIRDHAEIIQVMLKPASDVPLQWAADDTRHINLTNIGIYLPLLVYVPHKKRPDECLSLLREYNIWCWTKYGDLVLSSIQKGLVLSSNQQVAAEDSEAASRSCVKGNCILYFIGAHLKVVCILLYTDIAEVLKVNVTTRASLESENIKLSIYCDSLQRDDYLVSSTLSETVAETAGPGGGVSEIELSCQLGARARILQGSCCIRSFDEVFSDFDFMMKEHKPSQESVIITGSLNVMVDEYCAQPKIKKFMETVREVMAVLIPKNTTIPITKEKVFSTYSNNQLGILVYTCVGERPWARDKKLLNKFTVYRTPPVPRGVPQLKDHFNIDMNGKKHGCFCIHSGPQEPMLLWSGILCDPPAPCAIICLEQFFDHGGSDLHSAWNPKFAHTANMLGIFAHQFMYLFYIDIGIQVKRRLLMEHFSLMRCDSHLEQRHREAEVVTTPILIFTLHGKPRNRNIGGVQNGNHKGGGIDALREKIAASTKKGGRALLGIDVSKAFGEMIVVFRFVDENLLTTFCSNLWLKNYGMRQCLSTLADDDFICLFAPSTEILKTKDAAMQDVILRAGKNYEVQNLLLFATLQVSFGSDTTGMVNIDEMKKDCPSVGIADALYRRCSFLGNHALADSVLSSGYVNKIFLFSMPRPPEIDDLEDKVKFKGEGMLRIGILCKLKGLIVLSYNVFSIRIVLRYEKGKK